MPTNTIIHNPKVSAHEENRISVLAAVLCVFAILLKGIRRPPLVWGRLVEPCPVTGNPTPQLQGRAGVIYISASDSQQKDS
jgi:hypothetical protein